MLDLIFDDVQVEPTETNVDDVSDIRITALGTSTVNGEAGADRRPVDR